MKDRARTFQDVVGRRSLAILRAGLGAALCGLGLGGCSLTVPMSGTPSDETPTGSIKAASIHASPFSPQMDAEDARRATSSLETALDPQGNGTAVAWENPASGAKGSFVPLAQVYPKGDGICRPFAARVTVKGEPEAVLRSSACRVNGGGWVVGRSTPMPAGKPSSSKKSDNLAERDTGTQLR